MKLKLKKLKLAQLSHDNKVLPNGLLLKRQLLADELTPHVGGGNNNTAECGLSADCATNSGCKQF